jgi:uncharacterized membrane protein
MPLPSRIAVLSFWAGLALPAAGAAQEIHPARAAAETPDWLLTYLELTARSIEVAGIAIIVLGAVAASLHYLWRVARMGSVAAPYHDYRADLGRAILLGLEFLVAADIIATVAVDPTLQSLAVLAGIVLIRTFLSFSLEVEIEGRWPWRRGESAREAAGERG